VTQEELDQLIADSGLGGRSAKKLRDAYARQQTPAQPVEAPATPKAAAPKKKEPKKQPVAAGHGAPTPGRKPTMSL